MKLNNRGFSLIEVLVTVGLIGILVGIAVPSYNKYKQNTVRMALKADLGSGGKSYNAHYAVESTYCAHLIDVGLTKNRSNNPIYKKQAFYGFASADTATGTGCTGLDDTELKYLSTADYCYLTTDTSKKNTNNYDASTGNCPGSHTKATKSELAYGTPPTACVLSSNTFRLGAATDVSGLKGEFFHVDHEGRIYGKKPADGCTN